jgi:hypothetical protein
MGTSALTGRFARRASLLAVGALALHQLRYALAYGGEASSAMARQGHSYLGDIAPVLMALAVSLVCARLVVAALGRLDADPHRSPGRRAETVAFAAALLAIFSAQEVTEGFLAAGHPGGPAAVFAHGGVVALPLALVIVAVIAAVDRLLAGAERTLVTFARARAPRAGHPASAPLPATPLVRRLAIRTLEFGLARRPPPALLEG